MQNYIKIKCSLIFLSITTNYILLLKCTCYKHFSGSLLLPKNHGGLTVQTYSTHRFYHTVSIFIS